MKILKISNHIQIVYHISNKKFNRFNPNITSQGLIWFAKDKEDLVANRHGASIGKGDVYLYTCEITSQKIAGWEEYENKLLMQLEQDGFDTIDLGEDIAIINPNIIKILKIEKVN